MLGQDGRRGLDEQFRAVLGIDHAVKDEHVIGVGRVCGAQVAGVLPVKDARVHAVVDNVHPVRPGAIVADQDLAHGAADGDDPVGAAHAGALHPAADRGSQLEPAALVVVQVLEEQVGQVADGDGLGPQQLAQQRGKSGGRVVGQDEVRPQPPGIGRHAQDVERVGEGVFAHLARVHAADAGQRQHARRAQFPFGLVLVHAERGGDVDLVAPLGQGADDVEGAGRAPAADGHQFLKDDDECFQSVPSLFRLANL